MKKTILSIGFFAAILSGCTKDKLDLYDDSKSGTSIYFPTNEDGLDKLVSFGYAKEDVKDSVTKVIVRILGSVSSVDRPYKLTFLDSSTMKPGQYEMGDEKFVIPAGKVADTIEFRFKRKEEMRKETYYLYLKLDANENFVLNYDKGTAVNKVQPDLTLMKLGVNDIAGPPPFWTKGNAMYSFASGYLGEFSSLKFQLLMNYFNLDIDEIIQPGWAEADGNYIRFIGWAQVLKAYFQEMAVRGTPVLEANGGLMTMGPSVN